MKRYTPYKKFTGSFLPNCLLQYTGLNAVEKLVWARLAQFMGENEFCYPKQKTLAKEVGVSVSCVLRALSRLEEKGFLEVERPAGAEKIKRYTNKYYFIEHEVLKDAPHSETPLGSQVADCYLPHSNLLPLTEENQKKTLPIEDEWKRLILDLPKNFQSNRPLRLAFREWVRDKNSRKGIANVSDVIVKGMTRIIKNDNLTIEEVVTQLNVATGQWSSHNLQHVKPNRRQPRNNASLHPTKTPTQSTKYANKEVIEYNNENNRRN